MCDVRSVWGACTSLFQFSCSSLLDAPSLLLMKQLCFDYWSMKPVLASCLAFKEASCELLTLIAQAVFIFRSVILNRCHFLNETEKCLLGYISIGEIGDLDEPKSTQCWGEFFCTIYSASWPHLSGSVALFCEFKLLFAISHKTEREKNNYLQ